MVEACRLPRSRVVAHLAGLRNSQGNVIRIVRLLEVRQVASDAGCRRSLVLAADMTRGAVDRGMHAGEGKIRWRPSMVEFRSQPGVDRVALFALDGKTSSHVIWRGRLLKSVLMAGVTLDRQSLELSDCFALVAVCAIQPGVATDQRKAVIVLLHSLQDEVPSLHRVTVLAVCPHLAAVNIRVAVGAVRSHIGEHHFGVALRATDALVKAAQWILGLVVIKLGNGADRLPSDRRMTVLAGNGQVAVRAAGNSLVRLPQRWPGPHHAE